MMWIRVTVGSERMVAPDISAFDGREVAGAKGTGRPALGHSQVKRTQFGVLVPPRVVDPLARLQKGVVVPEKTGLPQPVGQSAPGEQRTPRHFSVLLFVVPYHFLFFVSFRFFFFKFFFVSKRMNQF